MAHKPGTTISSALSEEQIGEVVRLRTTLRLSGKEIARRLGLAYQSVTRELRKRGLNAGQWGLGDKRAARGEPVRPIPKIEQAIYTPEELAQKNAVLAERNALTTELKAPPANPEQLEERTQALARTMITTAERIVDSINHMSDDALAASTLANRTTALGIIVDKIKVIMNQNNPMFGSNQANQTINVVNIIAAATPPRKKDGLPDEVIDVTPTESPEDLLS